MIKLQVQEYCHQCIKFEPEVTDRPETYTYHDEFTDPLGLRPTERTMGDTIVRCVHRDLCENLHSFFKKQAGGK